MSEEEGEEETSQLWLLRHLRSLLADVQDSILSSFLLQQDCTPLRNFVNGYQKRRSLYICVKRVEQMKRLSIPLLNPIVDDSDQKAWKEPAPTTIKKAMGKKSVRVRRKKKDAPKSGSAELEPNKEEIALIAEAPTEEVDEGPPAVTLSWAHPQLPDNTTDFVFIITREQISANSAFDHQFHVGYCRDGGPYWRLVALTSSILTGQVDHYTKVDLLLLSTNAGFRWIDTSDTSNKLKNFIVETIGLLHADTQKKDDAEALCLPNMMTLLRPRLEAFAQIPANEKDRCRLLMELSLFDVDGIERDSDAKSAADRLTCALSTLRVLYLLHGDEHQSFLRKAVIYCIEMTAKVTAIHLKRKTATILSSGKCDSVWLTIGGVARDLFAFGRSVMEKDSDDALDVERIARCYALMQNLEAEIDRVRKLAEETLDERSDMDRQRGALEQAAGIVEQIRDECEQKGLLSVAESGNTDALKALIVAISAHFSSLHSLVGHHQQRPT